MKIRADYLVQCALENKPISLTQEFYLPKLFKSLGITKSNNEGRRLIDQHGVRINGDKIKGYNHFICQDDIVRIGRRIYKMNLPTLEFEAI